MSQADWMYLSGLVSVLLATMVVPQLVAIVCRQEWSATAKRWVAFGISMLLASIQWLLQGYFGSGRTWMGIAVTGPFIFGMAIASYNMFWKGKLGALEEIDLFAAVAGKKP